MTVIGFGMCISGGMTGFLVVSVGLEGFLMDFERSLWGWARVVDGSGNVRNA
jgi:hypothetical protein